MASAVAAPRSASSGSSLAKPRMLRADAANISVSPPNVRAVRSAVSGGWRPPPSHHAQAGTLAAALCTNGRS